MNRNVLAICMLALMCFISCDINALNELLGKSKEKFLEENIRIKDLKSKKESQEVVKKQVGDIDNTKALDKGLSNLVAVKEDSINANGKDNIIVEDETKGFQWWDGSNEKTWENLDKMYIEARARVKSCYDIWMNAIATCHDADKALYQAISELNKVGERSVNIINGKDVIFAAEKKVDAAVEVLKRAEKAEEKANEDRKAADVYLSKVEATIEVFRNFLIDHEGVKESQMYD
ncbi:hypothetical protein bcCo53_001648 (plasmid) [Borrelia coriaceae]|nr:hypothetical protein [Borrelia coriaceae]UPA17444.1 hypothetical protein bcCo53_001648 [Borrelia coriaceae]